MDQLATQMTEIGSQKVAPDRLEQPQNRSQILNLGLNPIHLPTYLVLATRKGKQLRRRTAFEQPRADLRSYAGICILGVPYVCTTSMVMDWYAAVRLPR